MNIQFLRIGGIKDNQHSAPFYQLLIKRENTTHEKDTHHNFVFNLELGSVTTAFFCAILILW